MNIAESMKNVLKHKGHIFTDRWKEDISFIMKEVSDDVLRLVASGRHSLKNLKGHRSKLTFKDVKNSLTESWLIIKILPRRISDGFLYFKDDLLDELERLPDQKQKTIFSMKVFGALTSFTLGAVYNVKMGKVDVHFKGIKGTSAFSRFIIAEIVFKVTRILLLRFLDEVEKDLSSEEDIKNIRYFKDILVSREISDEDHFVSTDHAIEIVENLKKFIMTGKRESE